MIAGLGRQVATLPWCHSRILDIEEEHQVSLKFWLTLDEDSSGIRFFNVHVAGGGGVFDIMPDAAGVAKARIITGFDDPLASSIWSCLDQLEHQLRKYTKPAV